MNDFKAMSVFVTVIEQGSMQAAAEKLAMTPSAITQSIQKLEQQLKIKLLNRTTRKISLTEAGEAFYQHANQMQKSAENAVKSVELLRSSPTGTLRISCPSGLTRSPLIQALKLILEEHSDFNMDLSFKDEAVDLIEERIDIALRIGTRALEDNMIARHIYDVKLAIVAHKDYLKKHFLPQTPNELYQLDWIYFASLDPDYLQFSSPLGKAHIKPNYRIKTKTLLASRDLTLQGLGISIQPIIEIEKELADGTLVQLLPEWELPKNPMYLVTLQRVQSEKVRIAVQAIVDYFERLKNIN